MEVGDNTETRTEYGLSNFKYKRTFFSKITEVITSPFRFFKFFCFWIGFLVLATGSALLLFLWSFYSSLPNIENTDFSALKKLAVKRTLKRFDVKGKKRLYTWRSINQVDRGLLWAIVMSEDGDFFNHKGIDYNAMINSLAKNIKDREYSFGGSTITQQVAKNIYLSKSKTILRKVKEMMIAKKLEKNFKKNEILEIYLNVAEFGPNIFGVNMATRHFFRKSTKKTGAAEGAFLGLMLPSPRRNYHSIFKNKYLSKVKKRKIIRVLKDLRYKEYITPAQYKKYSKLKFLSGYETGR